MNSRTSMPKSSPAVDVSGGTAERSFFWSTSNPDMGRSLPRIPASAQSTP